MNAPVKPPDDVLSEYLSGRKLFGDDFSEAQILEWYEDEKEGYAGLVAESKTGYSYVYHALNQFHGYRFIGGKRLRNVLGVGSAFGDEFAPIAHLIDQLTILDPSSHFEGQTSLPISPRYVRPEVSGRLPFDADSFDLITCLGVLHHIPNVTFVISELARCVRPGGIVLLREPTVSMGDWRQARRGLTKRERGIPREILLRSVIAAGLKIQREADCMFPAVPRLARILGQNAYCSRFWTVMDYTLARIFRWNYVYHPTSFVKKLRPTGLFLVASK